MARNRKHQSAAVLFGPALKAFLLCLLIGGAGVGYVWQKDQIDALGDQIKQREIRLGQLQGENEKLRTQLSILRSSRSLEPRVKELKLGLVQANPNQIWRLTEPVLPLPDDGPMAARNPNAGSRAEY